MMVLPTKGGAQRFIGLGGQGLLATQGRSARKEALSVWLTQPLDLKEDKHSVEFYMSAGMEGIGMGQDWPFDTDKR